MAEERTVEGRTSWPTSRNRNNYLIPRAMEPVFIIWMDRIEHITHINGYSGTNQDV